MGLEVYIHENENLIRIVADRKFNFASARDFRNAYRNNPGNMCYIVDFKNTQYMDSSSLGMLLILREHAGDTKHSVKLINCMDALKSLLQAVRFERYFEIS